MYCHGSFLKCPEVARIFFSMPIEALSKLLKQVESMRNLLKFPEQINITYDIIVVT